MISATNMAVEGATITGSHAYSPYMHHHLGGHHLNHLHHGATNHHHHHRSQTNHHQERYQHHRLAQPVGSTNLGSLPLNLVPANTAPLNLNASSGPIKVQALHPKEMNLTSMRVQHMHLGTKEANPPGTEALLNGVPHEALFRLHKSTSDFARPVAKHRYSNGVGTELGPVDLAQPKGFIKSPYNYQDATRTGDYLGTNINNNTNHQHHHHQQQQQQQQSPGNFFQYNYNKDIYGGSFVPPKPPALYQAKTSTTGESFKVPSGKEGSLKHRILRPSPPASVAPLSPQSPAATTATATISSGFSRGALIRLADGDMRRVEDMRADDFRRSADVTGDVMLTDVTVVRISEKDEDCSRIMLTLSFNQHRDRVDFETTPEHPFFVYGQGWASYSPSSSMHKYGLKCNRLQVGDICISLTPKEKPSTSLQALKSVKPHYPERKTRYEAPRAATADSNLDEPQNLTKEVIDGKKRRWSAPDDTTKHMTSYGLMKRIRE